MGSGTTSGRMPRAKLDSGTGLTGYSRADLENFTNRLSFTDEGNGQWTIDHPAFGGGQILEGTDLYNPKAKIYEARVWDSDYNQERMEEFGSLNEAKNYIKWRMASNFDPKKATR